MLGMIHEHQCSDRDTYIKVQYENIIDHKEVSRILVNLFKDEQSLMTRHSVGNAPKPRATLK